MDYLLLQDFLVSYSLPTLIVAVIVVAVSLTLNKVFDKLPALIKTYLPFLFAILIYFFYDCVFVLKDLSFRQETLYAGLLSGSLSVIISSSIKKIKAGKPLGASATILLIESLLQGHIADENLSQTATEIESALLNETNQHLAEQQVIDKITNSCPDISNANAISLSKLIVSAVNNVKNFKKD